MRRADDDHVLRDHRRAVPAHVGSHHVHRLIVLLPEIDDAVLAEVAERLTGLRVQSDELVANAHVENALVAPSVTPVADAAARQHARRSARAFVEAVYP